MLATAPNIDAVGRLVDRVAAYYGAAPGVWWSIVGLVALFILAWAYRGRDRGK